MSREVEFQAKSGWGWLGLDIFLILASCGLFISGLMILDNQVGGLKAWGIVMTIVGLLGFLGFFLVLMGFIVLQPNQAGVLLLFGKYVGSVRREGFFWVNPFFTTKKISLRLRNLNGAKLKVNDSSGNPIEIATVVVWKVEDTFAACFEVDDYQDYVVTQSESALRHLASAYPYDTWEDEEIISLRGNIDQVSEALEKELQERLGKAGVRVLEARLSHLAYAPEIAEAMLKRQQADAIIAARTKIVEGAVGMVQMALTQLSEENIVEFDDERRMAMVSNLLVVLCGESNAQPVVNAGTLYN